MTSVKLINHSSSTADWNDEYGNKRCYSYVLEKGRGLMLILVFGLFQSLPYRISLQRHAFFICLFDG